MAGEPVEDRAGTAALGAHPEVSPVEMDQHRGAGGMGAVPIEGGADEPPGVPVADVRDPLHITTPQQKGQQDARERIPLGQPGVRRVVGRLAPAGSELAAYGLLDCRAGLQTRQATTARPVVVSAATPSAAKPPGELRSPCASASNVEASSQ